MLIKPYKERDVLQVFSLLIPRMKLEKEVVQYYTSLAKGVEGEKKFADLLKGLQKNWLVLHDLLLEHNNSLFQIDTLIITENLLYLFDVKYFQGDYYIESGKWYTKSGQEVKDPILQLRRCKSLLRQFLQKYGYKIPVKGMIVFIHPEFTLYQSPKELPATFPTQINRLIKQLKEEPSELSKKHFKLSEILINNHIHENNYDKLPAYRYDQLKKGILCHACNSLKTFSKERRVVCSSCGHVESVDSAIIRSIKQFRLLFPDKKVTVTLIHDWCRIISSKKTIRRIIKTQLNLHGFGRSSEYVERKL